MAKSTIFISYAREDVDSARRLYEDLKSNDLEPWLDEECLRPGQPWKVAIRRAIKQSRYFLVLLSSNSVSRRGYVQKELSEALEILDMYPDSEVYLIPVRLDDCEPSRERLGDLHWVDMFPDWGQGLRKILCSIIEDDAEQIVTNEVKESEPLALLVEKHSIEGPTVELYFSVKNVSKKSLVIYDLGLQEVAARSVAIPCAHAIDCRVRLQASLGRVGQTSEAKQLIDRPCFTCYEKDTRNLGYLEPVTQEKVEELTLNNPHLSESQLLFQSVLNKDTIITLAPKESESFLLTLMAHSGCTIISTTFRLCALYHDEAGRTWTTNSQKRYWVHIKDRYACIHTSA